MGDKEIYQMKQITGNNEKNLSKNICTLQSKQPTKLDLVSVCPNGNANALSYHPHTSPGGSLGQPLYPTLQSIHMWCRPGAKTQIKIAQKILQISN